MAGTATGATRVAAGGGGGGGGGVGGGGVGGGGVVAARSTGGGGSSPCCAGSGARPRQGAPRLLPGSAGDVPCTSVERERRPSYAETLLPSAPARSQSNPNPNLVSNPNPNPNPHPHPTPNPSQVGSKWQSTVLGHFKHPEAGALYRARWLAEHYTTEPPPPPPPQQQQLEEPAQASGSESDPPTKKRRLSSQHLKWTPKGNPMHGDGSPRAASPALTASPAEEEATLNSTLPPAAMVAPAAALPPRAPASAYAEDTIKVGCNHRRGRLQP